MENADQIRIKPPIAILYQSNQKKTLLRPRKLFVIYCELLLIAVNLFWGGKFKKKKKLKHIQRNEKEGKMKILNIILYLSIYRFFFF